MNQKKVIRTGTTRTCDDQDGQASGTAPFPTASSARIVEAPAQHAIAPTDLEPRSRPTTTIADADAMVSELRDLCEAALLRPLDSPTGDPFAALERRPGQPPTLRQPHTTNHIADELVRRIKAMPQLRARVVSQLMSDEPPPPAITQVGGSETHNALKELRSLRTLLDNLGCPRSEDDRNLTLMERIRWLLDVMSATQSANEASGAARVLSGGDNTPATGMRWLKP